MQTPLKSTSLDSGLPWKQIASHLFHSSLQLTCPRCPHQDVQDACSTVDQLPATAQHLQEIIEAQRNDEVCMQVRGYCQAGWPAYMPYQPLLRLYWESRAHLAVIDNLLLYDEHIVIPQALRLDILNCIHCGHLGISKCHTRARMPVWWPGLSVAIEDMIKACFTCVKGLPEPKEPLMLSSFPSHPWERISMDLFE